MRQTETTRYEFNDRWSKRKENEKRSVVRFLCSGSSVSVCTKNGLWLRTNALLLSHFASILLVLTFPTDRKHSLCTQHNTTNTQPYTYTHTHARSQRQQLLFFENDIKKTLQISISLRLFLSKKDTYSTNVCEWEPVIAHTESECNSGRRVCACVQCIAMAIQYILCAKAERKRFTLYVKKKKRTISTLLSPQHVQQFASSWLSLSMYDWRV